MPTFSRVLHETYIQVPDRPAVHLLHNRLPDETLTYRQLVCGSAACARALAAAGVKPGEVVVLVLDHSADLIFTFFGTVLHGAVPSILPFLTEKLSPDHYRAALSALFAVTAPAAVISAPAFLDEIRSAGQGTSVRAILSTGGSFPGFADPPDFEILPGLQRSPDEIVLLQHSSGTTGLQKGVALSHTAVFNQLESYSRALHLRSDDVVVSWLPLYHDMGLIAGFLLPILQRVPLVLMSPFDWVRAPYKLLQAVSSFRGTLTWLPNFAYNFCAQKVRDRDLEGVDLSSWRAVINCSEPMHWQSHRQFLARFSPYGLRPESLATCYAMAENVFAVTQGGINAPVAVDWIAPQPFLARQEAVPAPPASGEALPMLSAGRPIANTRLRILAPDGRDLPERRLGEIALQSDCLLSGYYHRPDLTEKAFLDGWYLTGDLGYRAEGELYVTGRKKDLIIVGGKNIYPQDLERLAGEAGGVHPGRVVAFGVYNEASGTEDVVIVAETDEIGAAARQQIADDIRRRVTRGSDVALRYVHVVPRGWLLKTSSGKIARSANRDKYQQEYI